MAPGSPPQTPPKLSEHSQVTARYHLAPESRTSAVLGNGMTLTGLEEHTSLPWNALYGQMELGDDGEWRLLEDPWRLPLSFTLQATKQA